MKLSNSVGTEKVPELIAPNSNAGSPVRLCGRDTKSHVGLPRYIIRLSLLLQY